MGCTGFLNTMMFLFNGIIFLAGAAILGVGIWVKVDSGSIFGLIEKLENAPEEVTQLLNVAYLLIALGSVLLIIGFLGCCGAMRQSKCMLLTTIAGCFPKISQLFADNTVVVVSVALAIAALEVRLICAMTVSMKLFCSLQSRSAFLH
ncbi:Tetraspanin-1 [Takifugu flavidus]|uniref:Tetraspanin-1 n=1 Tax=Takifugu flavidus TaxID=433684 RepID=A0A5C6NCV4_9TELE|nr:Tetraspanin-1 [Takifugu flavidus]